MVKNKFIRIVISTIIVSLIQCKNTSDSQGRTPKAPEVQTGCQLGECYKDQFVSIINNRTFYYSIISEETVLQQEPSYGSKTITRLVPADIIILQYSNESNNAGKKEKDIWFFVVWGYPDSSIRGWINKKSIAYKSMFKPDHSFNGKKIEYSYGDTNYDFVFTGSNHYRGKWISTYPADKGKSGKVFGKLYRYKDILYFDSVQSDHKLFILLCDSGKDEGCMLKIIN